MHTHTYLFELLASSAHVLLVHLGCEGLGLAEHVGKVARMRRARVGILKGIGEVGVTARGCSLRRLVCCVRSTLAEVLLGKVEGLTAETRVGLAATHVRLSRGETLGDVKRGQTSGGKNVMNTSGYQVAVGVQ